MQTSHAIFNGKPLHPVDYGYRNPKSGTEGGAAEGYTRRRGRAGNLWIGPGRGGPCSGVEAEDVAPLGAVSGSTPSDGVAAIDAAGDG